MALTDPNKPEIITRTAFGGRSAVALGGNRYSIKSETVFKSANAVALPARGLAVDMALWVSFYAVLFRLPWSLVLAGWCPPYMALAGALLVLMPTLTLLGEVSKRLPDHTTDCWARLAMAIAGLVIATNGFWVRGAL